MWHWEHNEVCLFCRSIRHFHSVLSRWLMSDVFLPLSFFAADAELSRVHVPWLGIGERIQHEPHHTQTLAGKVRPMSAWTRSYLKSSSVAKRSISVQLQNSCERVHGWDVKSLQPEQWINHFLCSSWQFRRTTVTTLSTTFVTASVLARWCMAWFTSATYR